MSGPVRASLLAVLLAGTLSAAGETRLRGVNVHSATGPELDAAVPMHLSWVRMDVFWNAVEPANGVLVFTDLDRMVQAYRSRGLKILANLATTPKWACRQGVPPTEGSCVPQEGYFPRFVKAVAERYRGAIAAYGIWNEPDNPAFFQGEALSYVDSLLVPGATAIRQADPFAKVCAPELSGSWGSSIRPQSAFFDAIAQRGAQGLVDVVTQHVYEDGGLTGPDGILRKFFDGDTFHRSLLYAIDRSVLASRDVWITEFGFTGGGSSGNGNDVRRTYELFAPRDRVTALFVYELVDAPGDCGSCTGLLRANLSWKPGAAQMAQTFADLEPTPPAFRDRFDALWSAALFRWALPDGGASVADGRLANAVAPFRAAVADLAVTDFEISSTVRITDARGDPGSGVGLAGRASAASFGTDGYVATLRMDGTVVLSCTPCALDVRAATGKDPRAAPVRLVLRGTGDRISVAVDGVELLVARDATIPSGQVAVHATALATHDDVAVRTSPDQVLPGPEPAGTLRPARVVRR